MKTSSKARYALYLVTDIAKHEAAGPVPLRDVSIRQDISVKYLEQIAADLSHHGYLRAVRGAQGGYLLAKPAAQISAGDIMRAAEGGFIPVACLDNSADVCPRLGSCSGPAAFWAGLRTTIDTYTNNVTIEQLAN
jgi:Rrf2 family protein